MTSADFFAASNVLVVAGKGGVGKTTVGSAMAVAAASGGCHVMLIGLEGYSGLGSLFAADQLGLKPHTVDKAFVAANNSSDRPINLKTWGRLDLMQLRPDDALAEYLGRAGLGPVVSRFTKTSAVEVVATAAPGIRDLVTLGKIRQLEQAGAAEVIIVDAPASGHAVSLLTSPAAMADSADSGPIREQADLVLEMLADDQRCQVLLVTLPEETPVTETIETAYAIEDRVGVQLGPVVINGVWPEISGLADAVDHDTDQNSGPEHRAARFRLTRQASQRDQIDRLTTELPLPALQTPYLFRPELGIDGVMSLAGHLDDQLATPLTGAITPLRVDPEVPSDDEVKATTRDPESLDTETAESTRSETELPSTPVVLCLGPGGVGKTTVSAALALALARQGRRVVVLTIDPARRLADALGLSTGPDGEADGRPADGLSNETTLVQAFDNGELWAAMLDPAETFEQIIRDEAPSTDQAERILNNRLFKNLAHSLSGTNEYMAVERLYQLHTDDRFDVVVVDTPPSRHAVDFLDSPGRLTRFIDHRLYRSVFSPSNTVLRGVAAGGQLMLRVLGRMVGAGLVEDVVAFFADFQDLDDGFRRRADALRQVLADDSAVVAVVSPRRQSLAELAWIRQRVSERLGSLDLVVINRASPLSDLTPSGKGEHATGPLDINRAQFEMLAEAEQALVGRAMNAAEVADGDQKLSVRWLHERAVPVRDLEGLAALAAELTDGGAEG